MSQTNNEPYVQLLEVMRFESKINKSEDQQEVFKAVLRAVDKYALGKMEARPQERAQWLKAIKELKQDIQDLFIKEK